MDLYDLTRYPTFNIEALDLVFIAGRYSLEVGADNLHEQVLGFYVKHVRLDKILPNATFDEPLYRALRPDVDRAVLEGRFLSGFHHWQEHSTNSNQTLNDLENSETINRIKEALDIDYISMQCPTIRVSPLADSDVLRHYVLFAFQHRISPNKHFSETVYLSKYPDVVLAVEQGVFLCGFHHWLVVGAQERRSCIDPKYDYVAQILFDEVDFNYIRATNKGVEWESKDDFEIFEQYVQVGFDQNISPSIIFDEQFYTSVYPDVCADIRRGVYVNGFHHWIVCGRSEKRNSKFADSSQISRQMSQHLSVNTVSISRWRENFDGPYYCDYLLKKFGLDVDQEKALQIFLIEGVYRGDIPTRDFDETFYVLYYNDVQLAKQNQLIPSGFVHYVLVGQSEGRVPVHDLAICLKNKMGSLSEAVNLHKYDLLDQKIQGPSVKVRNVPRSWNVFVPSLDPDIMFGGYISLLNFLTRVIEYGEKVRLIVCEDGQSNMAWFLAGIQKNRRWCAALGNCTFQNLADLMPVEVGFDDICVAYSAWTSYKAASVAKQLKNTNFVFFIQEFEPIFHENNSHHFLVSGAYYLPHVALFNTKILEQYFRDEEVGVFAPRGSGKYLTYQHALADNKPDADLLRSKKTKVLLFYARPEQHAGRNLFEVGILALKKAVAQGVINSDWKIVGLGSLGTDTQISLGSGVQLDLRSRIPFQEYETLLRNIDIGLSLMWAPHPSVLPFELAKAGGVCVTNEYGKRTSQMLSQFGFNIVPALPTIDGLVEGIREAVRRAANVEQRIKSAEFDWPVDWDLVFHTEFIRDVLNLVKNANHAE